MRRRGAESISSFRKETKEDQAVSSVGGAEEELVRYPLTLLKTGSASLEASWRWLACAGDKRARAYTPKRRGESALRSMVLTSLLSFRGKKLSG